MLQSLCQIHHTSEILVRGFGLIGGGAVLAFAGATAAQGLIQAGVIGGLGIAGNYVYILTVLYI